MCGIIGYVGSENAVPLIVEGLKKLEYRGYDSAGIAVLNAGQFDVVKQKGRLAALEKRLGEQPIKGCMGIGHTRWATHGEPSDANAHPHMGGKQRIAVVHNGIIENYKQLKERLTQQGVHFLSQTDSEVIAHLAEHYDQGDLMDTVIKVASALEGSYALGIMSVNEPDTLIAIKKDNPLIVGLSATGGWIASDVPAILRHTQQVYYLEDKEIAVLRKDSITFYNTNREEVKKSPETITWSIDSAEKGGYEHFMLKEIMEQPRVLRDTLHSTITDSKNKQVLDALDARRYQRLVITACGSAYNAGVVGKYVLERLCRLPVEADLASEFRYKDPLVDEHTLVLLISQSGETADTIAALREAKRKGAATLAIVNVVGSTLAKEADATLYTLAGPEIAVATTKAFSAQLMMLYALAIYLAKGLQKITPEQQNALWQELQALPDRAQSALHQVDTVQKLAAQCIGYSSIFFIGRNIDYAIALEGSLKLKEISYIHSEAYAGGELKHGTISLIEENTLVVALACCPALYPKIYSNVEQVVSRGAKVLMVGSCMEAQADEQLSLIAVSPVNELFSPSLSVVILHLFAYYVAANKGLDIDKPRNLAKSVTVE